MALGLVPVMEVNDPSLTFFPPPSHTILLSSPALCLKIYSLPGCISCSSYMPLLMFLIYTSDFFYLVFSFYCLFGHGCFPFVFLYNHNPWPLYFSLFSCLSNALLLSPCLLPSVLPFHLADSGRSGAEDEGGRHWDQCSPEFPHRPGCRCQEPQGALIKNSPQLLAVCSPLLFLLQLTAAHDTISIEAIW